VVHEQIVAPRIGRDEAVPLVVAEPLDGTGCHEKRHSFLDGFIGAKEASLRIEREFKPENSFSERRNGNGSRPGVGIFGIRERATALGGTFEAGPCRDGFRIVAELPHRRSA
jgi:hypothetical protein